MFGYVIANLDDLEREERDRYQAQYCALCRALGDCYGQRCRLALTYDMVFLSMLLGSMYEPPETQSESRCITHPLHSHLRIQTGFTDYAADMTVALSYHKCLDDWSDDRSVPARIAAAVLARPYRRVQVRYPRQCKAIEEELASIHRIEAAAAASGSADGAAQMSSAVAGGAAKMAAEAADSAAVDPDVAQIGSAAADTADPDAAAACFGRILGELFVVNDDVWAHSLRTFGEALGRLIYVMDAACDLEKDAKRGNYNPLGALGWGPDEAQEALEALAARAASLFEKLPLERDLHTMRSVLYAGVWQKFNAQYRKADMDGQKESSHRG